MKPPEIIDSKDRIFKAWGSVEIVDKDGEIIPIKELEQLMPTLIDRGAPLMDSHTNRHIGKIIGYEFKEKAKGILGLKLVGKVFSHYPLDAQIWNDIKSGKKEGISFGGRAHRTPIKMTEGGEVARSLEGLEAYEFSIVDSPANPEATFEGVSFAKGKNNDIATILKVVQEIKKPFAGYKDFDDCVSKNQQAENPEAYCAVIMRQVEEGKKALRSFIKKKSDTYNRVGEDVTNKQEGEPQGEPEKPTESNLAKRVAKIESTLTELVQKLSAIPATKQEEEEKPKKPEEKKPEEKKPEEKKPEEEKTKEAVGGAEGAIAAPPEPEGTDVQLPKAVAEVEEHKPGTPEEDEGISILQKEVKDIKKQLAEIGVSTTPRPGVKQVKKTATEGESDLGLDIAKGKTKMNYREIEFKARQDRLEQVRKIVNR